MSWLRVTNQNKCAICDHGDWCMFSDKGDAFLCMRVRSNRSIQMSDGSTGYIHDILGVPHPEKRVTIKLKPKPNVDWLEYYGRMLLYNNPKWLEKLAASLNVTYSSLVVLGAVWSTRHQAWGFPMRDGHGDMVGIRLRNDSGHKWAKTGSKNALFIPYDIQAHKRLWLFEGPTDTAAAISIGLNAFGRPSCSSGLFDILTLVKRLRTTELVIVSDGDKVGLDGAEVLVHHLPIKSVVITVPGKDMRDFVKKGGRAKGLTSMVNSMVWRLPAVGSGRS